MAEHNKSLAMNESEVYGMPASLSTMSSESAARVIFPKFHYEGPEELDIPEEGTMTIRYCQKREVSEKRADGKHWYECDVEVKEIVSASGKTAPARSGSEAADALDKLMSEREENE